MKVLVLGSGGREHALAWCLRRELGEKNVLLHPGNAATTALGYPSLGDIPLDNREAVAGKMSALNIELVVIGPENLLVLGYADYLRERGFNVLGPGKVGAQLESSKIFAKEFMKRAEIPTAGFSVVSSPEELIHRAAGPFPLVLKLDGLAAGKGVVIAQRIDDVEDFATRVWRSSEFGAGPHQVLIEAFLPGREVSYIGVCDGNHFVAFPSATDFKRVGDGDSGPNTGGMGAISPSPYFNADLEAKIQHRIVSRLLRQLSIEGIPYRGVLYIGLMISPQGDPFVVEFNARFGDPETQATVLRADTGFTQLLAHAARGQIVDCPLPRWKDQVALYVVAAAEGYPGKPRSGDPIIGIDTLPPDVEIFYSGVTHRQGQLVTSGGRVLGLGGLAESSAAAREKIYDALKGIRFQGMHYRGDIGL